MNPTLNGSSALEHFKRSNAIEIRNVIMFDFYPGLPHITVKKKTRRSHIVQDKVTNNQASLAILCPSLVPRPHPAHKRGRGRLSQVQILG